jgi:hypothetical protein
MIRANPMIKNQVLKWKNVKMHQLMAAQSLLANGSLLSIDIFDLSKELNLLKE